MEDKIKNIGLVVRAINTTKTDIEIEGAIRLSMVQPYRRTIRLHLGLQKLTQVNTVRQAVQDHE